MNRQLDIKSLGARSLILPVSSSYSVKKFLLLAQCIK
jgi:hypothetical protein